MAINWTKIDLLYALRTEYVTYADLSVGDIIVDAGSEGPFQISEIRDESHPKYGPLLGIYDKDENGFTTGPEYSVRRLPRQALKAFQNDN